MHDGNPTANTSRPARRRPAPRQQVRRIRERASYEPATVHAILDAGFLAHVGFVVEGQPFVIPMLYARDGDSLLLHGSVASRQQQTLAGGIECCASVTHVDGLVLARSHFHHSVNYRSVVVFGRAHALTDAAAKAAALQRFVDAMIPGRAADARAADAQELAATSVLVMQIVDASAKVRAHGVKDHPDDLALPVWAGVVPMRAAFDAPVPEPDNLVANPPAYLEQLRAIGAPAEAKKS